MLKITSNAGGYAEHTIASRMNGFIEHCRDLIHEIREKTIQAASEMTSKDIDIRWSTQESISSEREL